MSGGSSATLVGGSRCGGSAALSNMVDECTLGLSLKYLPGEHAEDVRRAFEEHVLAVAATDPWLRDHPPEIEWGIAGVSFPPAEIPLDHPLAQAVASAYRRVVGEPEWLAGATRVGVTAGASAPEVLVREAVDALRRVGAHVREVHVVDESVRFALPPELEQMARERGTTLPARTVMRQSI